MALDLDKIKYYISFWNTQANIPYDISDGNVIALVGPTKAGKSTLINCFMGKNLLCRQNMDSEELYIVKGDEEDGGPVIGTSGESASLAPQFYSTLPDTDIIMVDLPGFGDNKGTMQEIANALSVQAVLRQQRNVRLALVVPFDIIKQTDPLPFYTLLNSLLNISPQVAEITCLIASKHEKGNLRATINKLIHCQFPSASEERLIIINNAKKILKTLIDKDALVEFKCPIVDEEIEECPFHLPNEEEILQCLKNLPSRNISNCQMVISDQAQLELVKLYDVVYMCLKKLIDKVVEDLEIFKNNKLKLILNSNETNEVKIDKLKKLIHTFEVFTDGSQSLVRLLTFLECYHSVSNVLEFSNHFNYLEKLRNECNLSNGVINGEQEFSLQIVRKFTECILNCNDKIQLLNPRETAVSLYQMNRWKSIVKSHSEIVLRNAKNVAVEICKFVVENKQMLIQIVTAMCAIRREIRR